MSNRTEITAPVRVNSAQISRPITENFPVAGAVRPAYHAPSLPQRARPLQKLKRIASIFKSDPADLNVLSTCTAEAIVGHLAYIGMVIEENLPQCSNKQDEQLCKTALELVNKTCHRYRMVLAGQDQVVMKN